MTTDALLKNLDELQARALKELEESASSEALEQWRVAFLGRRGSSPKCSGVCHPLLRKSAEL